MSATEEDTSSEHDGFVESTRSSENDEFNQAKRSSVHQESLDFTTSSKTSQVTASRSSLTSPEPAQRSRRSTKCSLTPLDFIGNEDLEGFILRSKLIERIRDFQGMRALQQLEMIELRQRMFVREQSDATLVEYMVNMCIAPVVFRQPRAKDAVDTLEQKEFDKVPNDFDEQLTTHVRTTYEKYQDLQSQFRCVQDEFKEHMPRMNAFMEIHAEERSIALEKQQDTLNSLAALQESILGTETKRAKE